MANRDVIEQAKGMLMLTLGADKETAFGYLRTASNHSNRRVAAIAVEVRYESGPAEELRTENELGG